MTPKIHGIWNCLSCLCLGLAVITAGAEATDYRLKFESQDETQGAIEFAALLSDNRTVLALTRFGYLNLFDSDSGERLQEYDLKSVEYRDVSIHMAGLRELFSGDLSADERLLLAGPILFDLEARDVVHLYSHPEIFIRNTLALFLSDRTVILAEPSERTLALDSENNLTVEFDALAEAVIDLSPDRALLAADSLDRTVYLLDTATGQVVNTLQPEGEGNVTSLAFSPDGREILVGRDDRTASLWEVETGNLISEFEHADPAAVDEVDFSPDDRLILTATRLGTVYIWDKTARTVVAVISEDAPITFAKFSDDGNAIITGTEDSSLKVWETTNASQTPDWDELR